MLLAIVPGSSADDPSKRRVFLDLRRACSRMGIERGHVRRAAPSRTCSRAVRRESRGSIMAAYNFLAFSAMLLAAPFFWFLRSACGLSARAIFVVAGLGTVPVLVCIVLLIPRDTLRFILRTLDAAAVPRADRRAGEPARRGRIPRGPEPRQLDRRFPDCLACRRVRFIVFADYFSGRFSRWFGNLAELIPIQPGKRSMVESLAYAREALQNGDVVGIFPEGEITRSGQMQEFRPGFLKMLKGTDAPVVPVYWGGCGGASSVIRAADFSGNCPAAGHIRY